MRRYLTILAIVASACGASAPMAPTRTIPTFDLSYEIHIPEPILAQQLITQHPNGVRLAPIAAQLAWDYTAWYRGSPNVYYGPLPPAPGTYAMTGVVVAPPEAARKDIFPASDWPIFHEGMISWVGRFVYTPPGGTR